jgi:transcriptional regulator with XRE-family HTH domain
LHPQTPGDQMKKHRLELHWLQADVAAQIKISSASVSNWERGITSPSRRMIKKIQEFLDHNPEPVPKNHRSDFHCQTCGISNTSPELCLFEKVCISFINKQM